MKFSEEIIKILDDLGKRLGFIIDWNNKNVMPYLEELMTRFIKWEISTSIIWIVVGIVWLIIAVFCVIGIFKNKDDFDYLGDSDEPLTWFFGGAIISTIIGITIVIVQCSDICQAIYLPELTIYEYIKYVIQ